MHYRYIKSFYILYIVMYFYSPKPLVLFSYYGNGVQQIYRSNKYTGPYYTLLHIYVQNAIHYF